MRNCASNFIQKMIRFQFKRGPKKRLGHKQFFCTYRSKLYVEMICSSNVLQFLTEILFRLLTGNKCRNILSHRFTSI